MVSEWPEWSELLNGCLSVKCLLSAAVNLPIQIVDWIHSYIDVNISIRQCKFTEAISQLEDLAATSTFGGNELITLMMGQCYYYNGEHDAALTQLRRAHANNYYMSEGLGE